nr:GerAB/ArcD/ProY family transporter [Cohnella sp. CFH 77786]
MTKTQLLSMITLYEIGSTTLFAMGIGAKQDAWVVVLLAMLVGFLLLWVYTDIARRMPGAGWEEILDSVLGKWLAAPLIFFYACYFFYDACLNFFEFGEIIHLHLLSNTPTLVINSVFAVTVMYMLALGLAVLARTSELLMPIFLVFLLFTLFFAVISRHFEVSQLLPVLSDGMAPVLKEVPTTVTFPFGETAVFLFYWKYAERNQIRSTAFRSVGFAGLLITAMQIVIITVLGPGLAANATLPLMEVVLSINIGEILTNLDVLLVVMIFIGGLFKMSINYFAVVLALSYLFRATNRVVIVIITGIGILWYSMAHLETLPRQRWIAGKELIWQMDHYIYQLIPLLVWILLVLNKKRMAGREAEGAS